MPPPTDGEDLAVAVSDGVRATIGSPVTYRATVSNAGTVPASGPVAVTVVVPPGQTISEASGTGWSCTNDASQATCSVDADGVDPGRALPDVSVTAAVAGSTYVANVYAAVRSTGDVNPANDERRGKVTVTPPSGGDQLYVQLAGALSLRSGGNVTSGDVSITPAPSGGLGGADRLQIDASVGTTTVQADLQRQTFTLFSGPVTITDPNLQGGVPLTVNWRGPLFGFGALPWRNLQGELLDARIPSLDVGGILGTVAGGLTFTLNLTAADYAPGGAPAADPPLSFSDQNTSDVRPTVAPPNRTVAGAEFTLATELRSRGGSTIGPVAAVIDLPPGLAFVRPESGTTCTTVPAVPGRLRCTLDQSLTTSLNPNFLGGLVSSVLPVPTLQLGIRVRADEAGVPLTVRATVDSANGVLQRSEATFTPKPPGPDLGVAMVGPERTSGLFLTEGVNLNGNVYALSVDNAGTATSGSPTIVLTLPDGVTFRDVTHPIGVLGASRFACSAEGQVVTCTRSPGVPAGSLNLPVGVNVRVNVAPGAVAPATAVATVSSPGDVDPDTPDKTATSTARIAAADAQRFDLSLSNGAFAATNRPVLEGGFTFSTAPNGRLDSISGCGLSMNYVPPVLAVPIVGPTLVPEIFADNQLCVDLVRTPGTNSFTGTVGASFVTPPVFLPPPVPQELPLPPIIRPRSVTVSASTAPTVAGPDAGWVSGSADGTSLELILNGGQSFSANWRVTTPPEVTCTDVALCP
jgi:uncharacterized repeat protein (TIGR01451 family)